MVQCLQFLNSSSLGCGLASHRNESCGVVSGWNNPSNRVVDWPQVSIRWQMGHQLPMILPYNRDPFIHSQTFNTPMACSLLYQFFWDIRFEQTSGTSSLKTMICLAFHSNLLTRFSPWIPVHYIQSVDS